MSNPTETAIAHLRAAKARLDRIIAESWTGGKMGPTIDDEVLLADVVAALRALEG
jgi:hypothetical protein